MNIRRVNRALPVPLVAVVAVASVVVCWVGFAVVVRGVDDEP